MQPLSIFCCSKNDNHKILHVCSKRALYWLFAILRLLLVFFPQTGYIHPDEFFQFVEVAAGKIPYPYFIYFLNIHFKIFIHSYIFFIIGDSFDIDVYKPWEFNVTFPVRNSLFPQLCVRIPYFILGGLNPYCEYFLDFSLKTPYFLILFPRLMMTILSFISDYCLYKICLIFRQSYIDRLTIFASSYVMLIYSSRTFSNAVEMILTSVLLYHVSRCIELSNKVGAYVILLFLLN
jgi:phosphatidylinositol glycan class Z